MPLSRDYRPHVETDFPGVDLLSDAEDRRGATTAPNVEYVPGRVETRKGFAQAFDPTVSIARFYNWLLSGLNRLIYFSPGALVVRSRNQVTAIIDDVVTGLNANTKGASFMQFGARIFMALFDDEGVGVEQGRVWNGLFTNGTPDVDTILQPPLTEGSDFTASFSEPLAGDITSGLHRFAFVWETRNGYQTKPSEDSTFTFTATGNKNIRIVLNPVGDWPDWPKFVHVLMTTQTNTDKYFFVPGSGSKVTVPFATSSNITIDIDIEDVSLAATGDEATDWFSLKTGPSSPHVVISYGNRAVYLIEELDTGVLANVTSVYISEPFLPQWITADRHLLRLPGFLHCTTTFVLHNILYLVGPNWTYAVSDNGAFPVNWAAPQLIDGRIGTLSPHGVAISPTGGFAWVASTSGLYPFDGGAFPNLPTSYYQKSDWERINWNLAPSGMVQVVDDSLNERVYVLAPLDAATQPSHVLTWDYKHGKGPDPLSARYSLWDIASYAPGSLGIVQNVAGTNPRIFELWLSNSAAGQVLRQKSTLVGDTSLYNDTSSAINSSYRTRPLPAVSDTPMRHGGGRLRVTGSGPLPVSVLSYDEQRTVTLTAITGVAAPGQDTLRLYNMQSECCHYNVSNGNVADQFFALSRIVHYSKDWVRQR